MKKLTALLMTAVLATGLFASQAYASHDSARAAGNRAQNNHAPKHFFSDSKNNHNSGKRSGLFGRRSHGLSMNDGTRQGREQPAVLAVSANVPRPIVGEGSIF